MYDMYGINELDGNQVIEYLRKSRSDDPLKSVDEVLEKHESILAEWVSKNLSSAIPEKNIYREVVSGETISERPQFQQVLKLIESPLIKAILVVEVQRLSRGDLEDAGRLIKLLRYTNTLVITPVKTYDLNNDYDRDFFERELKRGNEFLEYTKRIMGRGRLESVRQGNFIGSIPPYGYVKTTVLDGKRKCPTLAIKENEAEVVRMIFDMYVNQGMGHIRIANALDGMKIKPPRGVHWSAPAIRDMLSNIHYTGKVRWNWRQTITIVENGNIKKTRPKNAPEDMYIFEGKHPAIISEDLFEQAQIIIGKHHRSKPNTKIRNPLASIIYCSCGRAMSLRTYNKNGNERAAARLLCDGQTHCHSGSVYYTEMIDYVCLLIRQYIKDFELKLKEVDTNTISQNEFAIKRLTRRLKELDEQEVNVWKSFTSPDNKMPQHVFNKLTADINTERADTKKALAKAYEEQPALIDYEKKIYKFKEALFSLKNPDVDAETKNKLLKEIFDKIVVTRQPPLRMSDKELAKLNLGNDVRTTHAGWYSPPFEVEVFLK